MPQPPWPAVQLGPGSTPHLVVADLVHHGVACSHAGNADTHKAHLKGHRPAGWGGGGDKCMCVEAAHGGHTVDISPGGERAQHTHLH